MVDLVNLYDKVSNIISRLIVDNLTTDDSTKILSAKQGKNLQDNKINKSDIANNLTTTASGKVLDARRGVDIYALNIAMQDKVDKVAGKGLSTNDYSNADKTIVDNVTSNLAGKVDKVTGKGLSTNDFTNNYKTELDGLENSFNEVYSEINTQCGLLESDIGDALDNLRESKVDKVAGKGLSTNDFTSTYKNKLDNLDNNLSSKNITVEKQATAETGYAATYVIKQNSSQVGVKINIPKDLLLQSASVETVGATATALETANNLTTGDSYIKLIANTIDGDNAQTPLVIPINDIFDLQTADESTITLSNGVYAVKASGITATQIKNSAVTTNKLGNLSVTAAKLGSSAVTTDKLNNGSVTTDKLNNNSVTSDKIVDSAVTTDKLNNNSVTTDKIVNGTILNEDIADKTINAHEKIIDESITSTELENYSIITDKIHDYSVTNEKIASSAITNGKLADESVSNGKIRDGNVSYKKLEGNLQNRIDGKMNTLAKDIPAGADLNDYYVNGFYSCRATSIAKTVANYPNFVSKNGFGLVVMNNTKNELFNLNQFLLIYNNDNTRYFIRSYNHYQEIWTTWKEINTSSNFTLKEKIVENGVTITVSCDGQNVYFAAQGTVSQLVKSTISSFTAISEEYRPFYDLPGVFPIFGVTGVTGRLLSNGVLQFRNATSSNITNQLVNYAVSYPLASRMTTDMILESDEVVTNSKGLILNASLSGNVENQLVEFYEEYSPGIVLDSATTIFNGINGTLTASLVDANDGSKILQENQLVEFFEEQNVSRVRLLNPSPVITTETVDFEAVLFDETGRTITGETVEFYIEEEEEFE